MDLPPSRSMHPKKLEIKKFGVFLVGGAAQNIPEKKNTGGPQKKMEKI